MTISAAFLLQSLPTSYLLSVLPVSYTLPRPQMLLPILSLAIYSSDIFRLKNQNRFVQQIRKVLTYNSNTADRDTQLKTRKITISHLQCKVCPIK